MKKATMLRLLLFASVVLVLVLALAVPAFASSVLVVQPATTDGSSLISQQFPLGDSYRSRFVADDFVNGSPWSIDSIFIPTGGDFGSPSAATSLTWQIYADESGKPAGDPISGGAYWVANLPPNDPQVSYSDGANLQSDVLLSLATPLNLPAGHWWLVFYPTASSSNLICDWRVASTTNGDLGQWINPGGYLGFGTAWVPFATVVGPYPTDLAFQLDGNVAVASAQAQKQDALSDLNTLLAGSLTKTQRPLVSSAAKLLTQSLKASYWVDDLHLKKSSGLAVFACEGSAAGSLVLAGKAGVSSTALGPIFTDLVTADRLLASTAIADAIAAPGNAGKIASAQKYLAKGDTAAAANQWVTAIGYYGTAWMYAVSSH
jgi:hypothetical protein